MTAVPAVPAPAVDGQPGRHTRERLIWWHTWAPGLFSFRISRSADYRFTPGQFARLGEPKSDGSAVWRAFSIASGPAQPYLEFYAVLVPEGEFTPLLDTRREGAEIWLDQTAQGFLTADRLWREIAGAGPEKHLWMLATGTGLGPYLAMLEDADVWREFDRLIVVHSVRHASELGYAEALRAWVRTPAFAQARARLTYLPTVTRESVAGCLQGRIPALIESGSLADAANSPLEPACARVMLCGNPDMVEATRKLLKSRGFSNDRKLTPGHIAVENYW